jgi:hypothetical protein
MRGIEKELVMSISGYCYRSGLVLLACAASACSSQDATCLDLGGSSCDVSASDASTPLSERIATLESELGVGSSGEDVRTVHEYLTEFGYFPSQALLAQYPTWRPVVSMAPERVDVFDETSEHAVKELQRRAGLEVTGTVNEATRNLMRSPRCGMPDGNNTRDLIEKFALQGSRTVSGSTWAPRTSLKWRFEANPLDPIQPLPMETAITAAFTAWSNETSLTFSKDNANPDIHIFFADLSARPASVIADGSYPSDSVHNIRLDTNESWSVSSPPAASIPRDVQDVVLHEVGHTLGLYHSSYSSTMKGYVAPHRELTVDDTVAISTLYDTWREGEGFGQGRDIGVGGDGSDAGTAPDVWVVGMTAQTGGFQVFKWNGSGYDLATGGRGATAISVGPTGIPWIVSGGKVYERSSTSASSGTWNLRGPSSNCATDVAAGPVISGNSTVWEIGCTALPGGFDIGIYHSTTQTWTSQGKTSTSPAAVRIAVESGGVAWAVANDNAVYRDLSESPSGWQFVSGLGTDVGAGPTLLAGSGYVFVTGTADGEVYVWDEQAGLAGDPDGPAVSQFAFFNGEGTRVAVGPDGKPWLVASDNSIWRTVK